MAAARSSEERLVAEVNERVRKAEAAKRRYRAPAQELACSAEAQAVADCYNGTETGVSTLKCKDVVDGLYKCSEGVSKQYVREL